MSLQAATKPVTLVFRLVLFPLLMFQTFIALKRFLSLFFGRNKVCVLNVFNSSVGSCSQQTYVFLLFSTRGRCSRYLGSFQDLNQFDGVKVVNVRLHHSKQNWIQYYSNYICLFLREDFKRVLEREAINGWRQYNCLIIMPKYDCLAFALVYFLCSQESEDTADAILLS